MIYNNRLILQNTNNNGINSDNNVANKCRVYSHDIHQCCPRQFEYDQ